MPAQFVCPLGHETDASGFVPVSVTGILPVSTLPLSGGVTGTSDLIAPSSTGMEVSTTATSGLELSVPASSRLGSTDGPQATVKSVPMMIDRRDRRMAPSPSFDAEF